MAELFAIALLGGLAWLWYDSLRAREAAMRAARSICAAEGLLLLDDTVSIAGLKPVRDASGRMTIQRAYDFEYSDTGNNRLKGDLVMQGHRLVLLNTGERRLPGPARLH